MYATSAHMQRSDNKYILISKITIYVHADQYRLWCPAEVNAAANAAQIAFSSTKEFYHQKPLDPDALFPLTPLLKKQKSLDEKRTHSDKNMPRSLPWAPAACWSFRQLHAWRPFVYYLFKNKM